MEFIAQLSISLMTAFAGLFGLAVEQPADVSTVEIGIREVSPKGEEGGFAIPASGCSAADPNWHGYPVHDCATLPDIWTDTPIIRYGEEAEISWDPHTHTNCVLSSNLMLLTPTPNGNFADSRIDAPTGETLYTITCDGVGNEDEVRVRVLPRIQET